MQVSVYGDEISHNRLTSTLIFVSQVVKQIVNNAPVSEEGGLGSDI